MGDMVWNIGKIPESTVNGDCFQKNSEVVLFLMREATLVHGLVSHPRTGRHTHCWIELDGCVFDYSNGHRVEHVPMEIFYRLGGILDSPDQLKRYDCERLLRNLLQSQHYGPWELPDDKVTD